MKKRSHLFNVSLWVVVEIFDHFYLQKSTILMGELFSQRAGLASVTSQSNLISDLQCHLRKSSRRLWISLEVSLIPKSYFTSRLDTPVLKKNNETELFCATTKQQTFLITKNHINVCFMRCRITKLWYLKLNLVLCMNQSVFMVLMLCCLLVVRIPNKLSILIGIRKGVWVWNVGSDSGSCAIVRHFRRTAAQKSLNILTHSTEICSAN